MYLLYKNGFRTVFIVPAILFLCFTSWAGVVWFHVSMREGQPRCIWLMKACLTYLPHLPSHSQPTAPVFLSWFCGSWIHHCALACIHLGPALVLPVSGLSHYFIQTSHVYVTLDSKCRSAYQTHSWAKLPFSHPTYHVIRSSHLILKILFSLL